MPPQSRFHDIGDASTARPRRLTSRLLSMTRGFVFPKLKALAQCLAAESGYDEKSDRKSAGDLPRIHANRFEFVNTWRLSSTCSMNHAFPSTHMPRLCLREPIPEIAEAARYLDAAVSAHLDGQMTVAEDLIRKADMPAIREWTESLWGVNSPYVRFRVVENAPPHLPNEQKVKVRMPTTAEKRALHERDGYHCRFCGIPVIRATIRERIKKAYPNALSWGRKNTEQHPAFQAMWLQYDHVLPHARGGNNDLENILITCAPCNYGRWNRILEEVGLIDPRLREPVRSHWDGLERFR